MRKLIVSVVSAVAGALGVCAADYTLDTNDASGSSSFDNFNASGKTQYGAPTAENDYYTGAKTLRTSKWTQYATFGGNSLHVGSVAKSQVGVLAICKTGGKQTVKVQDEGAGLFLEKGRIVPYGSNCETTFDGKLTVLARKGDFYIGIDNATANANFTNLISATMHGDEDAWLTFKSKWGSPFVWLKASGEKMADYHGTIEIAGTDTAGFPEPYLAQIDNVNCPGNLIVNAGSTVRTQWGTGRVNFGGITLKSGSKVNLRFGSGTTSQYRATDKLTVEKDVHLVMLDGGPNNRPGYWWPFLAWDANATAEYDLDNFVFDEWREKWYGLPTTYFAVSNDVAEIDGRLVGTNYIVWAQRPIIHIKADSSNQNNESDGQSSAFTNAVKFSDGLLPHANADYVVTKSNYASGFNGWRLMTPQPNDLPDGVLDFPGDSLTIGTNCEFKSMARVLNVKSLRLLDGSQFFPRITGAPSELNGEELRIGSKEVSDNDVRVQVYYNNIWTCNAPLTGDGRLRLMANAGSSKPGGQAVLTGLSTNFLGSITVTSSSDNGATSVDVHETLVVSDVRNLGGALPEFRPDALLLERWGTLEAAADLDFNTENRGVCVNGQGQARVPDGKTLTISNDITWNGDLRKCGAGTLAVGGAARRSADGAATLTVAEGFLTTTTESALVGVTVRTAGGSLVAPAVADVAEIGKGVRANFEGEVAVTPALGEVDASRGFFAAACTVADGAEVTVKPAKIKGLKAKVLSRDNGDGTVTLYMAYEPTGTVLILR